MSLEVTLSDFFQRVANAFLDGDHLWLSNVYAYPMAVYFEGQIQVEATPAETVNALAKRREVALARGTRHIRTTVLAVDPVKDGRIPVRVDWEFLDANGVTIAVNELRYYCVLSGDGTPRIEMLEFLTRGLRDPRIQLH